MTAQELFDAAGRKEPYALLALVFYDEGAAKTPDEAMEMAKKRTEECERGRELK